MLLFTTSKCSDYKHEQTRSNARVCVNICGATSLNTKIVVIGVGRLINQASAVQITQNVAALVHYFKVLCF